MILNNAKANSFQLLLARLIKRLGTHLHRESILKRRERERERERIGSSCQWRLGFPVRSPEAQLPHSNYFLSPSYPLSNPNLPPDLDTASPFLCVCVCVFVFFFPSKLSIKVLSWARQRNHRPTLIRCR